jgi:hypothetical protein
LSAPVRISHSSWSSTRTELAQVAVAQRLAQREGLRQLLPRGHGLHVGQGDFWAIPKIERQFFDLAGERAEVRSDAGDQFAERIVGDVLFGRLDQAQGLAFRPGGPILVVGGQSGERLDRTQLLDRR